MAEKERSIIHLEYQDNHYYFGSLGALYSKFNKEQLGIAYGTLRNYRLDYNNPYKNDICTIRKGKIVTSSSSIDSILNTIEE